MSSQLIVDLHVVDGGDHPCRWLEASRPTPTRRAVRAADQGELAAWETVAVPLAAACSTAPRVSSAVLNRRRGTWTTSSRTSVANNVHGRATLDAMNYAVVVS